MLISDVFTFLRDYTHFWCYSFWGKSVSVVLFTFLCVCIYVCTWMPWKIFVQNAFFPAAGSSPPKLSRVGATSKTAAVDEDEEEKENATQCKPGMEGGEECWKYERRWWWDGKNNPHKTKLKLKFGWALVLKSNSCNENLHTKRKVHFN